MKIGIFGTGAYAMAVSNILSDNNCKITMWTKFQDEKEQLEKNRGNEKLIPNFKISSNIIITNNVIDCLKDKDLLIIAIPTAFIDSLCQEIKPYIKGNHILITSKGIEQGTNLFINQILTKYLDTENIAVLSGPTFAKDIPKRKPIALTLATKSIETEKIVKIAFTNNYTKLSTTTDIIGTEICGSLKNIYAIASGILSKLDCNESTKAMFLTDAITELKSLIINLNGDKETCMNYAGLGDLLLTCSSTSSRNFHFGELIVENLHKEDLQKYLQENTIEGVYTLKSVMEILNKNNFKLPIVECINDIINNFANPNTLLETLMNN